jgi:acyl dehydratase
MSARDVTRQPGDATAQFSREIMRGDVQRFVAALGLKNPVHHSVDAARAAGFPDVVAPISYVLGFSIVPRDVKLHHFGVDETRAVASEFTFDLRRPICAGDVLTARTILVDVAAKATGKPGTILSFETAARDPDDGIVLIARDSIIEVGA